MSVLSGPRHGEAEYQRVSSNEDEEASNKTIESEKDNNNAETGSTGLHEDQIEAESTDQLSEFGSKVEKLLKETSDYGDGNKGASTEVTIFFVMSYIIGVSLVKTPILFTYSGWQGMVVVVFVAITTAYTARIVTIHHIENRQLNPDRFNFYGNLFETRRFSFRTTCTAMFTLYIIMVCMCALNDATFIIHTAFHQQLRMISTSKSNQLRLLISILSISIFPLTLLRSPKKYWYFACFCTSVGALAGLLLAALLGNLQAKSSQSLPIISPNLQTVIETLWSICNLVRFFGLHAALPILLDDVRDTESAPKIVVTSFAMPTIFILIAGMMSYFALNVNIPVDLLQVIDSAVVKSKGSLAPVSLIIIQVALCIQSVFVFVFSINALNLYFERSLLTPQDGKLERSAIRAFSSIMICLFTAAMPNSAEIFNLINILLACVVCVIIPLMLSTKYSFDSERFEYAVRGMILFIVVASLGGAVFAYLVSLSIFSLNVI